MPKVHTFNGGLSLRVDPTLIHLSQAQTLLNADVNSTILKSDKTFTETSTDILPYFYNFKDEWKYSSNEREYIEYENKLYFTDKPSYPKVYDGTNTHKLGIDKPVEKVTVNRENFTLDITIESHYDSDYYPEEPFDRRLAFVVVNDTGAPKWVIFKRAELLTGHNRLRITIGQKSNIVISIYEEDEDDSELFHMCQSCMELSLNDNDRIIYYPAAAGIGFAFNYIWPPEGRPSLTLSSSTISEGYVQYAVTYYNVNNGLESAVSPYSDEEYRSSGNTVSAITLSDIPQSSDPQVTHIIVYRLGGDLTTMTKIAELPIGTTDYLDDVLDVDATEILTSHDHYPPKEDLIALTEAYGILFGLVGAELKFSEIDEPGVWPPENSIKLRQDGTGLLPIQQGILVFTKTLTYLLTGTNKSKFSLILISTQQGCLTNRSCQVLKNMPLWVSYDGICSLNSGYVSVISKSLLDKISLDVKQSIIFDERYFLLKTDGTLLILDMRAGVKFYESTYESTIDGMAVYDGKLYFAKNDKLCTAFTGEEVNLEYTSPVFIDNNHAEIKMYHHIYIRADGEFTVKIIIDGVVVLTQSIAGNKTFDLKPPAEKQRGYGCSLNIVGKGTIYTIDINPFGRQNGV